MMGMMDNSIQISLDLSDVRVVEVSKTGSHVDVMIEDEEKIVI